MASISTRSSDSIPSNPPGMASVLRFFHEQYLLHLIHFLEFHFDDLVSAGLHHAPHVARLDGQLTPAPVDQNQQLHPRGTSLVEQRVESGANGASGVEHVVHQNDV